MTNNRSPIRFDDALLRLAVLAKGLQATHIKIFMRPDQFEDTSLFRFPDASKLRAERVELQWGFIDLYALMFFHLFQNEKARKALDELMRSSNRILISDPASAWQRLRFHDRVQREIFSQIAGPWMGSNKKRGATYSWLIQHLADARGETTPRGFLTALRAAAHYESAPVDQVIDYRGIQFGVAEASDNRVDDLLQDYWWIDYVRQPMAGLETPLEKEVLFDVWKEANTAETIRAAAKERGLPPVYLTLRAFAKQLPPELARALSSDEGALLETLRLIAVVEIRPNGKVNVPDIFRVAFKMKRRGGVPPKKVAI